MEPAEQFALKRETYRQALRGFTDLLAVEAEAFSPTIADGLRNGQAQKFEYTTEMTWKLIRRYLLLRDGIEANSPKSAAKAFYLGGHLDEADYETLMAMIDDRNHLSHIYRAEEFDAIIARLPGYAALMGKLLNIMENN